MRTRAVLFLPVLLTALAGCASQERRALDEKQMLEARAAARERLQAESARMLQRLLERTKADQDAHAAGRRFRPASLDVLVISGGGDWGAFGASFLKGWGRVPAAHPLARPQFDAVTGVSTGALIAPFAFLGSDDALEAVVQMYRNPQPDLMRSRGLLFFLPGNPSFAEVPGLERELDTHVTLEMLRKVAEAGSGGRLLAVNTTNLDDSASRVFDLVAEARRALASGSPKRIHDIMLASSAIPGAFPSREIDGEMYVDGGMSGNIIYGGTVSEEESLPALWQKRYPGVALPKMRFWVIFNNQVRNAPVVVQPRWGEIMSRSLELSSRTASLTAMRHLFAMAEIWRLKRAAEVEVRVVAVPDNWQPPVPGVFVKESMNALSDLGEKMGADPSSWRTDPP